MYSAALKRRAAKVRAFHASPMPVVWDDFCWSGSEREYHVRGGNGGIRLGGAGIFRLVLIVKSRRGQQWGVFLEFPLPRG